MHILHITSFSKSSLDILVYSLSSYREEGGRGRGRRDEGERTPASLLLLMDTLIITIMRDGSQEQCLDLHDDDVIASDGFDWLQVARQQRLELSIVSLKHSQLNNRQTQSHC